MRNDVFDTGIGSPDSCASQDDIRDAAVAPVPDARLMCDYDALSGPGEGYDTLSHATTAAVQRYENKVTEKFAKEYEFVDGGKYLGEGYAADADDDDLERIEHARLRR